MFRLQISDSMCSIYSHLKSFRKVRCLVREWRPLVPHHTAVIQPRGRENAVLHATVRINFYLSYLFCGINFSGSNLSKNSQKFVCIPAECEFDRKVYADGKVFAPAGSGPCLQCRCKASLTIMHQ